MQITAKFVSKCPACDRPIAIGAKVEWERGSKARHVDCSSNPAPPPATRQTRSITVERVGRRSYLRGDTISVRGFLRAGGCHWDAESKAWWIGCHDAATSLADEARIAPAEAAPAKRITNCVGCGCRLDDFAQRRGFRFCSKECYVDHKFGGQSGYHDGQWHQGSED